MSARDEIDAELREVVAELHAALARIDGLTARLDKVKDDLRVIASQEAQR